VPALFIASSIFLIANALYDQSSRWATVGVFGAILAGIPVFYLVFNRRVATK
jgi:basic amino acid/polyamine antiporter, APA family